MGINSGGKANRQKFKEINKHNKQLNLYIKKKTHKKSEKHKTNKVVPVHQTLSILKHIFTTREGIKKKSIQVEQDTV